MKFFSLLILTFSFTLLYAEIPASVYTFYNCMEQMNNARNNSENVELKVKMQDCIDGFQTGATGIDLPNDFLSVGLPASNKKTDYPASYYISDLSTFVFEKKVLQVSVEFSGNANATTYVPDFDENSNASLSSSQSNFETTYVKKIFKVKGQSQQFEFNDTVMTNVNTGRISTIFNGGGSKPSENVNELRAKAAFFYTVGRYRDAYECYKKIIEIDTKDADSYYRLGLMTYYQSGCTLRKKDAHKMGVIYLEKARDFAFGDLKAKAHNVLTNWERKPFY